MKTIIIPAKDVSCLAQALAVQEADIHISKDPKSSFYLAQIPAECTVPENVHGLDYQVREDGLEQSEKRELLNHVDRLLDQLPKNENTFDIRMRFHLPGNVDLKSFESALQTGIGELVRGIINDQEDNKEE